MTRNSASERRPAVAPLAPPFEGVERIAVLRGGGLGDLVFALPAIEALAGAYPASQITLLGMPGWGALLEGRAGTSVSEVVELPVHPGVRAGEADPAGVQTFLAAMRERRFDLAVQAHGGGRNSNPFLLRLGARFTVGAATPDAARLTRDLPYVYVQHEVDRWLEVAGLAGAAPVDLDPVLVATDAELAAAREVLGAGPAVVLHPGATDPRRRWPTQRFGAVAAEAARLGASVHVVGDAGEAAAADDVIVAAHAGLPAPLRDRVRSLAGQQRLGELIGVLAAADLVVANDSGPRHLAQALGTATIGVFWVGNAFNAAPRARARHRIHLGWATRCPVCGVDITAVGWTAPRCPHDMSVVADVPVDGVLADLRQLLEAR